MIATSLACVQNVTLDLLMLAFFSFSFCYCKSLLCRQMDEGSDTVTNEEQ